MTLPDPYHFEANCHLSSHLWCYPPKSIKFYSDTTKSPLAQFLIDAGHPLIDPFSVLSTDPSFHDSDDGRSTGGSPTLLQGGIAGMNSLFPIRLRCLPVNQKVIHNVSH
jgi:hypothetical protein